MVSRKIILKKQTKGTLNQFLRGYFWPRTITEFQTGLGSCVRYFGAIPQRVFLTTKSIFILAKAISLSSTTNWPKSHNLKAEPSTLPSDKGSWTTSSLKLIRGLMVSGVSHHYKAECWLNDFCALCLHRTTFIFRWSKCDYPKTTKHQSRW